MKFHLCLCILLVFGALYGQQPTMEDRIVALERRVAELERIIEASTKPAETRTTRPDVLSIYHTPDPDEALAAAKPYLSGLWSSKGYETSGNGFHWMKWNFLPDGRMFFHSAYSSKGVWEVDERQWTLDSGRLKSTGEFVYVIRLDPEPSGSIIIQKDGTLKWATGEFECTFIRGDQFASNDHPDRPKGQ